MRGERNTIAETVLKILRYAKRPLRARELMTALLEDYGRFCKREFWRVMRKLQAKGWVRRVGIPRDGYNGGYERV